LITHVHETSAGRAKLLSRTLDVECNALFLGDAKPSTSLDAPLTIEGSFTYAHCTADCVVTEESVPTEIIISRLGHETSHSLGYSLLHVNCQGFINCTFKSKSMQGEGKDASESVQPNGEASLHGQTTNKESGLFCLDRARLDLVTMPLSPVYITS
jgi:hypothetical protein